MNIAIFYFGELKDEFGNKIEKNPTEYPYNYDGFVIWKNSEIIPEETAYSDRLWREDNKRHDYLCLKYFGDYSQNWDMRSPELIEKFLMEWMGNDNIRLSFIMKYCNQSNGNPYWRFDFKK